MMKKILVIVLFVSFGLSREPDTTFSNGWDGSISYGLFSEKAPFSFLEWTSLLNVNKHSEFYGTFSYLIFGGSLGLGYKYYTNSKSKSSMFISTCAHYSLLGDGYDIFYGISVAPGYSILQKSNPSLNITYREKFGGELKQKKYKKTAINVGISFLYMGDNSMGVLPFISWENRF